MGQFTEVASEGPDGSAKRGPLDDDPTLCPDDFFHITGRSENAPASRVQDKCRMNDSSRAGMYMAENTANDTTAFEDPSNNISTFLSNIARSRSVTEPNIKSWVSAVENNLANFGIFTIAEVIGMVPTLNHILAQAGHVPTYFGTLELMGQEGVRMKTIVGIPVAAKNAETRDFFLAVASSRNITGDNVELWVAKVRTKLHRIDVGNVQEAVSLILMVNRKLRRAGLSMMHQLTINCMAQKVSEITMLRRPSTSDASFTSDVPSGDTNLGQCLGCDGFGAIYTLCTVCEDSGIIYDPIERSNESDDSIIPALKELGTCPSCNRAGITGQTCNTYKDDAVYLNFSTRP
jgi:hypothetical protein